MKVLAHGNTSISPRTTTTEAALMPSDTCNVLANSSAPVSCSLSWLAVPSVGPSSCSHRPAAAELALASTPDVAGTGDALGSTASATGASPVGSVPRSCSSVSGSSIAWAPPAGQRSMASAPAQATHDVP